MHHRRKSGILLHPTSLPGPGGIGSLGKECRHFIDFLEAAGQSLWQILPLGPAAYGNSPYSCYSAFAGNPLLIDLAALVDEGDLDESAPVPVFPAEYVDFALAENYRIPLLKAAAAHFYAFGDRERKEEYWHFCDTTPWLHDYALFMALKEHFGGKSWTSWPKEIARREPAALEKYSVRLGVAIGEQKYAQWQFYRQWRHIREYANGKGIGIVGDIPIFVAFDSADVWSAPHLFKLDEKGKPTVVAGVPPDYFSETGQRWGNPLYNWDAMAAEGYRWWIERFRSCFALCDMVRIDHFRGFEACWEVPAKEKTAVNGQWVKGPGAPLFDAVIGALGQLPIIAEDLGVITPEVEELRDRYRFPGMKILQFAFDSGPGNPYLPHNYIPGCVTYTGTHDNDTTVGWFKTLSPHNRKGVLAYTGTSGKEIHWELVRLGLASVADLAIFPLQDILGLDGSARMNLPGTPRGNWSWRFTAGALAEKHAERLHELTTLFGRKRGE
ncbi:4-alpha-glucanotransferase [Geobacter metallireducens RCH3]|uniref:4-alpha-glucanotransferase n=1 Tax=Geobacter metallireducens (strain ATCC 53774 / DSM 7210 / GS-15) TaxID=269799 RepID=Q39T08_GEOMG|nr:4-alpha-glucanotransferase [Geobacter metallireducens]ABB32616.1 4-alpha-glucanotransferase [Geobacter metallireducens GS-15]EHP83835.1 4-alpha-glucanotransferase [Geobacter metallireducens RCH3]